MAAQPAQTLSTQYVPWIPSRDWLPPVARPFDAFIIGGGGPPWNSKNIHSELNITTRPQSSKLPVLEWTTAANSAAAEDQKLQAVLRAPLPVDIVDGLIGLRFTLEANTNGELNAETFWLRNGSFWSTQKLTSTRLTYQRGSNIITWLFDDNHLDSTLQDRQKPNGIALFRQGILKGIPATTLRFSRIEFIFKDATRAIAFRTQKEKEVAQKLSSTAAWIQRRGINIPTPTIDQERILWSAMQLLALSEQLNYWSKTAGTNSLRPFSSMGSRVNSLITQFPHLSPQAAQDQVGILQKSFDTELNKLLADLPVEIRRWKHVENDNYFRTPYGEPYRMFGPMFFRSIYPPRQPAAQWRPEDLRYLTAIGFNGIRLDVQWNHLEPERGKFSKDYVDMLLAIMREAERYGLGVSIDLHWPYPDWFLSGAPGYTARQNQYDKQASYHWPDALVSTWERIGEAFKNVPNIVAFEMPSNETTLANNESGLKAYPYAVKMWNDWLRQQYHNDRTALASAWGTETENTKTAYALQADENWDSGTIEPLGYQNDLNPDMAYQNNPRFWDHIRFVAQLQTDVTSRIISALRQNIPDAEGMFQHMIGDVWDRTPIPVDYHAIETLVGPHVNIGTHYGMGSNHARKALTISQYKSYDSEQQMENRWHQVQSHVQLGLGFCPFAFHARGGGGMLFSDDDWYLKPEVTYLPKNAAWIRNYWPNNNSKNATTSRHIAIIENTRRAAAMQSSIGDLPKILESQYRNQTTFVSLFEGLRIVREPSLLNASDAVILDATQLDPDLLDVLVHHYRGKVLLYGRLDQDAFARTGEYSILNRLAQLGILFVKQDASAMPPPIPAGLNLEGAWKWAHVGLGNAANIASMPDPKAPPRDLAWETINVPGEWPEVGLLGSSKYFTGDAWYHKTITIPDDWKDRSIRLKIGAIDDFDWVFLNGQLIGKTGRERSNWWIAPREYLLPPSAIRWGQNNEILICVRNDGGNGGITKSPVMITSEAALRLHWMGGKTAISKISSHATFLPPDAIRTDASVLAKLDTHSIPALVRHDRWTWWMGDTAWQGTDPIDQKVIQQFLAR